MKRFALMFEAVDATTSTNAKVKALATYFAEAPEQDKVWAIAIMSHRRPKRPMTTKLMREWAAENAGIPDWLFEESYHIAGDLAETISLLTHNRTSSSTNKSLSDFVELIIDLKGKDVIAQKQVVQEIWNELDFSACFIFNKLLTGGFRMGISRKLMTRALAQATGIAENELAHKLMGNWDPQQISYEALVLNVQPENRASKPYPFYLAHSIPDKKNELGPLHEWQIEWKWDGIRGQLIVREAHLYVWTRGEELVTDRYPEYSPLSETLPHGTVIDGEILAYKDGLPMDFRALQKRLGRKVVSTKIMQEIPVIFMAYDILEHDGKDVRDLNMGERRTLLEQVLKDTNQPFLKCSPIINSENWETLAKQLDHARENRCEGFMVKHKLSTYQVGRKKGDWWKWKVKPYSIDAVLTFAMRGHGRRANLYTDYTFGLWQDDQLMTFAKAYSGLTDSELKEIDAFVKKNTLQRFGPVRSVEPVLVFEIAFEDIALSKRHKAGVAVRFPRILRWRKDKLAKDANSLADLKALVVSGV